MVTASVLWVGSQALVVELPKHSYDLFISRSQSDIGHQLAGNTYVVPAGAVRIGSEVIARGGVDLPYQRKQAFNEPSAAGVHVVETWKNDAIPYQAKGRLTGFGKWLVQYAEAKWPVTCG